MVSVEAPSDRGRGPADPRPLPATAAQASPSPVVLRVARLSPWWVLVGVLAVLAAALASLMLGPVGIPPLAVVRELVGLESGLTTAEAAILREIRLPRAILGLLVGATLSVSGAAYQGVFRNPLADPYLLGAAAGAGLGVTIVIVGAAEGSITPTSAPLAAFVGALGAVALSYVLGTSAGGRTSTASLILAGVAVASFLTALHVGLQRNQD